MRETRRIAVQLLAASTLAMPFASLYWITKAGVDPALYMQRWPGRFPLVHVKDSAGPPAHEMTDVGSGTLDWRRIFALHRTAGIRHYFVEHDSPADPFASIEASYRYLRQLQFRYIFSRGTMQRIPLARSDPATRWWCRISTDR